MAKYNIYKDVTVPVKVLDIIIIAAVILLIIITVAAVIGTKLK